ncbi:MAG: S8 family serine peptidase [Kiritimatiellae bacterium]|nr:S8 family serine peptidase [Kiritimatiellia bacterium]
MTRRPRLGPLSAGLLLLAAAFALVLVRDTHCTAPPAPDSVPAQTNQAAGVSGAQGVPTPDGDFPILGKNAAKVSKVWKNAATAPAPRVPADADWNLADPASRRQAVERLTREAAAARDAAWAEASRQGWGPILATPDGEQDLVAVRDGRVYVYMTFNANAAISTAADLIRQTPPYDLTGTGVTVGVWDSGSIRATHQEFGGRIIAGDSTSLSDHSTHVGGTIGASGVDSTAKGMAPQVRIESYEWFTDLGEMTSRAMSYAGETNTIQISNHSYGFGAGWDGSIWYGTWGHRQSDYFGIYDTYASLWDTLCYNAPYYLPFVSAGNDRNDGSPGAGSTFYYYKANEGWVSKTYEPGLDPLGDGQDPDGAGYDTLPVTQNAKNILTIGSVGDAVSGGLRSLAGAYMSYYSSWGPTDDGRIKPDVVANGESLYSCSSAGNASYTTKSGTSMASPNAAGSASLLVEYYGRLFTGLCLRASTLKGLLIHTADDLGNAGPDYAYGFGLLNVKRAADHIKAHHDVPEEGRMVEAVLSDTNETDQYDFRWDGTNAIRVTLCWTDPPALPLDGLDNRSACLVNDLDLRVIGPAGGTNFPYVLNVTNPAAVATTGDNIVDNVEQIHIATPTNAGLYTVVVQFKGSLYNGQQAYSLLVGGSAAAPAIQHTPLVNTTNASEPYAVEAVITPAAVLDTNALFVFWNTDGSTNTFTTNAMAWVTNDFYRAEIPAQSAGTVVYYFISATAVPEIETRHPTNAPAALHSFEIVSPVDLAVTGSPAAYGTAEPDYGSHVCASGVTVNAWAGPYSDPTNGVRYACTGWVGQGSVPASGATNAVSFVISMTSTVNWQWAVQFGLVQTSSVKGILDTTNWWIAGTTGATLAAEEAATLNGTNYHFAQWLLNGIRQPDETNAAANPAGNILMDSSRVATAVYLPTGQDEDGDGLADWWEYFHFGSTNPAAGDDPDGDAYDNLAEHQDDSDPRDGGSVPSPPVITHTPLADPQRTPAPWDVVATVTDNVAVTNVQLYYRRLPSLWAQAAMTNAGPDEYRAAIPIVGTNGHAFQYYIKAWDAGGNWDLDGVHEFDVAYALMSVAPASITGRLLLAGTSTNEPVIITNLGIADLTWTASVLSIGFADDCESGDNGWTHGGTNDFWHLASDRWNSATQSWYCGSSATHVYEDGTHAWLVSPPILVGWQARLTFQHWADMELDAGNYSWDGGIVEISTNNGVSFETMTPEGGYPYLIVSNQASPFAPDTPCYAGSGGWQEAEFDLSAYAGLEVRLRFRFGSDAFSTEEGWFIDDISVTPRTGTNNWLQAPTGGIVAASSVSNVTVTLDTAGILTGDFAAYLRIADGDPYLPWIDIPVSISVRSLPVVAILAVAQTSTNGAGFVTISNTVYDADDEQCQLELLYSADAGINWTGAWIGGVAATLGVPSVTNGLLPQVYKIETTTGLSPAATNLLAVTWDTTNSPVPIVVVTDVLVRARAWDGLFWSATVTSQPFLVDNEAPLAPSNLVSSSHTTSAWSTNRLLAIGWDSSDDGEGVGLGGYSVVFTNIFPPQALGYSLTSGLASASAPLADGTNWWAGVAAVDMYGNRSATPAIGPFWIDATAPSAAGASVTIAHSAFGSYLVGTVLTGSWSGFSDALSGLAGYYLSRTNFAGTTNGDWTIGTTGTLDATADQTNFVYVWAEDVAGNIGLAVSNDILVLDPAGDWDGDGLANEDEEIAGTGADSTGSVFVLEVDEDAYTNRWTPVLTWPYATNRDYTIHRAEAAAFSGSPPWSSITNPDYTVDSGWATWSDTNSLSDSPETSRFYRIDVRVTP